MIYEKGTMVIVGEPTDGTMSSEHMGKRGHVISHNTNGLTGNTVDDPLHEVAFEDGSGDAFWYEELIPA
jgi:hypothetical protein